MTANPKCTTELTSALLMKDAKAEDLTGYVLNPKEISELVVKVFTLLGIQEEDIRCVKVASDNDNKPHIIAEVRYKAVKSGGNGSPRTNSWTDFIEGESDEGNREALNTTFCMALRNCAYHGEKPKNLHWKKVVRNDTKYAQIEFDPYIFIAFAYNINFCDKLYRISAPAARWMSEEEMDNLSGKERKKILRTIQEYKSENLRPCTFYVTFSPRANARWKLNDGQFVEGFHPTQIEAYFQDDEQQGGKKKKKH